MSLKPLCPTIRSKLRSGVAITSPTQCVEELVLNSIDSGATCIAVRFDLELLKIQVIDNGCGLIQDDLEVFGERYLTSKCHRIEDLENLCHYGFRGEAVASIADVSSSVEVESRHKDGKKTYRKVISKNQKDKHCAITTTRPSSGTTMTVYKLFFNQPVRRKAIKQSIEIERMCRRLEAIALINPTVSISLRNDASHSILFQTRKCSTILGTFRQLFGCNLSEGLCEVNKEVKGLRISGFISKCGHTNSSLQFAFVNKRLVLNSQIHKCMNYFLAKSLVVQGNVIQDSDHSTIRSKELFPIFVIDVTCPIYLYDITFHPSKLLVEFQNWTPVVDCLAEVVNRFLTSNNLLLKLSEDDDNDENSACGSPGNRNTVIVLDDKVMNDEECEISTEINTFDAKDCLCSNRVCRNPAQQKTCCFTSKDAESKETLLKLNATLVNNSGQISSPLKRSNRCDTALNMSIIELSNCSQEFGPISQNHSHPTSPLSDSMKLAEEVGSQDSNNARQQSLKESPIYLKKDDIKITSSGRRLSLGERIKHLMYKENVSLSKKESKITLSTSLSSKVLQRKNEIIAQTPPTLMRRLRNKCEDVNHDLTPSPTVVDESNGPPPIKRRRLLSSDDDRRVEKILVSPIQPTVLRHQKENVDIGIQCCLSQYLFVNNLSPNEGRQKHTFKSLGSREKSINCVKTADSEQTTKADVSIQCSPILTVHNVPYEMRRSHLTNVTNVGMTANENISKDPLDAMRGSTKCTETLRSGFEERFYKTPLLRSYPWTEFCPLWGFDQPKIAKNSFCSTGHREFNHCNVNQNDNDSSGGVRFLCTDMNKQKETEVTDKTNKSVHLSSSPIKYNFPFDKKANEKYLFTNNSTTGNKIYRKKSFEITEWNTCTSSHDINNISGRQMFDTSLCDSNVSLKSSENVVTSTVAISCTSNPYSLMCSNCHMTDSAPSSMCRIDGIQVHNSSYDINDTYDTCIHKSSMKSKPLVAVNSDTMPIFSTQSFVPLTTSELEIFANEDHENQQQKSIRQTDLGNMAHCDTTLNKPITGSGGAEIRKPFSVEGFNYDVNNNAEKAVFDNSSSDQICSEAVAYYINKTQNLSSLCIPKDKDDSDYNNCNTEFCTQMDNDDLQKDVFNIDLRLELDKKNDDDFEDGTECAGSKETQDILELSPAVQLATCSEQESLKDGQQKTVDNLDTSSKEALDETKNGSKDALDKIKIVNPNKSVGFSSKCEQQFRKLGEEGIAHWTSRIDSKTGRTVYVHLLSGNSTFEQPKEVSSTSTEEFTTHPHLSHNAGALMPRKKADRLDKKQSSSNSCQPLFEDHLKLRNVHKNVKWRSCCEDVSGTCYDMAEMLKQWENPVFNTVHKNVMNIEVNNNARLGTFYLHKSYKFNSEMLMRAVVVQQIDKKFIACLVPVEKKDQEPSLLVFIDQHAAHERIRLEQFVGELFEDVGGEKRIKSSEVKPAVVFKLNREEVRILLAYNTKLLRADYPSIGVCYDAVEGCDTALSISRIPYFFTQNFDQQTSVEHTKLLLKEKSEKIQKCFVSSLVPASIHKVLCSVACHGAIKFGDKLSFEECVETIHLLQQCKLPFQCAHGRPSIVPIIDLADLTLKCQPLQVKQPPKLWKLRNRNSLQFT